MDNVPSYLGVPLRLGIGHLQSEAWESVPVRISFPVRFPISAYGLVSVRIVPVGSGFIRLSVPIENVWKSRSGDRYFCYPIGA